MHSTFQVLPLSVFTPQGPDLLGLASTHGEPPVVIPLIFRSHVEVGLILIQDLPKLGPGLSGGTIDVHVYLRT